LKGQKASDDWEATGAILSAMLEEFRLSQPINSKIRLSDRDGFDDS
jgi:hypothetical protein